MSDLKSGNGAFVAPSGRMFVYLRSILYRDGDLLYSPDGKTFYELAATGGNMPDPETGDIVQNVTFTSPHNEIGGELHHNLRALKVEPRNGGADYHYVVAVEGEWYIDYDGERYVHRDEPFDPSSVTIAPLPATRKPEYLCRMSNGAFLYVSAAQYNYSYESFRLFIGDGTTMREVEITGRVVRMRPSGGTTIPTAKKRFCSPGGDVREGTSKWGDATLTNLDPGGATTSSRRRKAR